MSNSISNFVKEELSSLSKDPYGKYLNAAGVLPFCPKTGRYLVVLRSEGCIHPNTWSGIGGAIEDGEDPKQTAKRELEEEVGYDGDINFVISYKYDDGNQVYYNHIGNVPYEFLPQLNWEASESKWLSLDAIKQLPNLHPGFKQFIEKMPLQESIISTFVRQKLPLLNEGIASAQKKFGKLALYILLILILLKLTF